MILLTDEEIGKFVRELTGVGLSGIEYRTEYDIEGLLKAQLKKVVEWLDSKRLPWGTDTDEVEVIIFRKEGWQALLEETK